MSTFSPGLALSQAFYAEAVRPIVAAAYPDLRYAAALLGPGSEVLGFDDATSTDHHWGPRVDIYVSDDEHGAVADGIMHVLREQLPVTFRGYSTNFEEIPGEPGTLRPKHVAEGPVEPFVTVTTVRQFLLRQLGFATVGAMDVIDWLTIPEQRLCTTVGGAVHHDDIGELTAARESLSYYPDDSWRYLLASQWQRIGQEEPFVGRAGQVGDELGSAVLAARLVRDTMRLAFLIERTYAPYSKWFGTAFQQLEGAAQLTPHLLNTLKATDWQAREQGLSRAYEWLARRTNELGVAGHVTENVSPFHGRPFKVIHGDEIAQAIRATISDSRLRSLPLVGSVDQWSDSTDVLGFPERTRTLKVMYGG